jgi:hypothetical protein
MADPLPPDFVTLYPDAPTRQTEVVTDPLDAITFHINARLAFADAKLKESGVIPTSTSAVAPAKKEEAP